MTIKKLAKLVKEERYLGITSKAFGEQNHQWIGGNWGVYDISDLPDITFEQACVMFDYSEKTIDKIINNAAGVEEVVMFAENAARDTMYKEDELEIHSTFFGDEEVKVIVNQEQSVFAFIPAALLSPIVETKYTTRMLVKDTKTDTYLTFLLVYEGLQLIAILPTLRIPKERVEHWQESQTKIYNCMSLYQNALTAEEERRAANNSDEEHQYTFDESEDTEGEDDAE